MADHDWIICLPELSSGMKWLFSIMCQNSLLYSKAQGHFFWKSTFCSLLWHVEVPIFLSTETLFNIPWSSMKVHKDDLGTGTPHIQGRLRELASLSIIKRRPMGHLTNICKYLKRTCTQDKSTLFSFSTRGSIRKHDFTVRVTELCKKI